VISQAAAITVRAEELQSAVSQCRPLAESWKQDPPFPGDNAFGNAIADYRENIIQRYTKLAASRESSTTPPHGLHTIAARRGWVNSIRAKRRHTPFSPNMSAPPTARRRWVR
jgi:hypothetical protein